MKEFKGTEGRWVVKPGNVSGFVVESEFAPKSRKNIASCGGQRREENAHLISAAPDFLQAALMGQTMQTTEFLHWIADRLVFVYGENNNADFIISLRERADAIGKAVEKALGESK